MRPGLQALIALARGEAVSARTIAFRIAPRLNAAGRMSDGALAVRLLLARGMPEALDLAAALEAENNARRARGEEMLAEARACIEAGRLAEHAGIVVHSEAFHEGIIGITAARLAEEYHRPVVVLARNGDGYKGSARSVPGFNVTEALHACASLLGEYGGHSGAAGCKVPSANVQAFRERFAAACAATLPAAEPPARELDGRLDPALLDGDLVRQLQCLAPFGYGNEEPCFLIEQGGLPEPKPFSNGHLRWNLGQGKELVGWGLAEKLPLSTPSLAYRVRLGFNDYKGQRKIQGIVEEFRSGT
jgi:single-stranded-DNA-specific exonuclease